MENNTLKASIGIDFSLIGTQLHAMYEKNEGGYAVLLIPSEQTPDSGISVKDLIDDIKKMAKGVSGSDTAVDTTQLDDRGRQGGRRLHIHETGRYCNQAADGVSVHL